MIVRKSLRGFSELDVEPATGLPRSRNTLPGPILVGAGAGAAYWLAKYLVGRPTAETVAAVLGGGLGYLFWNINENLLGDRVPFWSLRTDNTKTFYENGQLVVRPGWSFS